MSDFTSLITSVAKLLSDPSPDVVKYASEAIIEMGKPAATKVSRILINTLNSFSSSQPVNRIEILKAIREITKFSPEPELIRTVCPTIITLLTSVPQIEGEVSEICQEILCNFSDRSINGVIAEFHDINVTLPLTEFFIKRARNGELTFFMNNNVPTNLFIQYLQKSTKVTEEPTRIAICNLLIQIAANLSSTIQLSTGCGLSVYVADILEQMSALWYKSSGVELQKQILSTIGNVSIIAGEAEIKKRADKLIFMFYDAASQKNLKQFAPGSICPFMTTLEKAKELPAVQTQNLAKALIEYILNEYANMQTDGLIMKSLNEAVGALSTIQILYPAFPLETTISKLPNIAAFFILNYFCSSLATTVYATKLIEAIANVKFASLKSDQKEMYCNCFSTLIRKCTTKHPKINEIFKNVITFISTDQQNSRGTILSLIASARQSESSYDILYPVIFEYINNPVYFFASPTLIEIASLHISKITNHEESLDTIRLKPIQLVALLMSFYYSEVLSFETKQHISQLVLSLSGCTAVDGQDLTTTLLNQNNTQDYHFDIQSFAQKYFDGYIQYGGEKPILPANIRSALRGGFAIFCGHLMESEYCRTKADQILSQIMSKFDRNDLIEVSCIAKFIGLSSIYLPDFAMKFTKTQSDTLVANIENKYKFWVKKNETGLPMSGVVLCVSELLENSPQSLNLDNISFTSENKFVSNEHLPKYSKLRFWSSALMRVKNYNNVKIDNKKFANNVLGSLKDLDVSNAVASVAGIAAAYCIDEKLIGDFNIINEIFSQVKSNWNPYDVATVILKTADIAASAAKRSKNGTQIVQKYQDIIQKYVFSEQQNSALKAMSKITDNLQEIDEKYLTKLAAFYGVVYLTTINDIAKTVCQKLLNKLSGFADKELNAETIANGLMKEDIGSVFEALGLFSSGTPFQYQTSACDVLKMLSKNETILNNIETSVHYFTVCFSSGMDVKDAFVSLIEKDPRTTLDTALSVNYTRRLSNLFSSFISKRELSQTVIQVLTNGMLEGENKGEVSFRILHDTAEGGDLRFEGEREKGIFGTVVMKNKLISTEKINEMARKIIVTEVSPNGDTDYDVFVAMCEKNRVDKNVLLDLATQDRTYDKEYTLTSVSCLSALLQYEQTAKKAIDGLKKIIEQENKDTIQQGIDALINLSKAPSSVRNEEFERVVEIALNAKDSADVSSLLLTCSETINESQLKNVGVNILKYVREMLCLHSSMLTPLRIISALSTTNALMCEQQALDCLSAIYPLCLVHIYTTDKETAVRSASQIARKLAYPEPSVSSLSMTEFADKNASASINDSKNPADAAKSLIVACHSPDATVKSVALYFAAAANVSGIQEVVNELSNDPSPEVRVSALKAIVCLESK
ncbi:hypothetical protein TVAG_097960 [Trichomonas vaginalis G3]|uniref:HEAT repeat family protein n=1 Tax=Trichomonas vaginalis (strain ATCC PRA-98 / G3) TaxID=412133 RepID=A2E2C6_TRIV3|nr:armadillo (ARM) repeat-containing protein family [Trichomonas vaginalis G3]EAY13226.1 hypothetical protein TVAG_097960 [Trichomonas vaginalis G3]KAI5488142.1 armadillo (ARM) repeat-containing protein family [Trichomonas vaginalis G3]|eukprot:XP_001325449.1 hypothetical protein [Trichomonas vaginalis G3]